MTACQNNVERLKIFHGTIDQAKDVAMVDNNQFIIDSFLSYRGNPRVRTTVEFEVLFQDGSVVWLPYSKDLFDTQQYEAFCRRRPELFPLLYDRSTAEATISTLNKTPITEVEPGDTVLVDLRSYGATWYNHLHLPDKDHITYLVPYRYTKWIGSKRLKIEGHCPLFNETFPLDHLFVSQYGTRDKNSWIKSGAQFCIVDKAMLKKYPELLPSTSNI